MRNLKGGNEARGQVRRRLKFRPIFCPFFSFSLLVFPLWLPFSLSHTLNPLPLFSPFAYARAYIYFRQFLCPSPYRELQSHPIILPIFHPLSLVLGKPGFASPPRLANVHPRLRTPCTLPPAPLLIHLSQLTLTASLLSPLINRSRPISLLSLRRDIEARDRLTREQPRLLIPWRISSPSAIPVPPELHSVCRTCPTFLREIREPRARARVSASDRYHMNVA